MNELSIPFFFFVPYTAFCIVFIYLHYKSQKRDLGKRNKFWSNSYIFEIIPSVFPGDRKYNYQFGINVGIPFGGINLFE